MSDEKIKQVEIDISRAVEKLKFISVVTCIPSVDVAFIFGIFMVEKYGSLAVIEAMKNKEVQEDYDNALKENGFNDRFLKTLCDLMEEKIFCDIK